MVLDPETKPAVQSKTVLANSVSLIAIIVVFISARTHLPPEAVDSVVAPLIAAGVSNILAILARVYAKFKIGGLFS